MLPVVDTPARRRWCGWWRPSREDRWRRVAGSESASADGAWQAVLALHGHDGFAAAVPADQDLNIRLRLDDRDDLIAAGLIRVGD